MESAQPDSGLNWQKALEQSKGIIPWLVLACNLIYGYAVKSSTSERVQQQQLEDHVAVMDMRDKVSRQADDHKTLTDIADKVTKLQSDQAQMGAKLDTFMTLYPKVRDDGAR